MAKNKAVEMTMTRQLTSTEAADLLQANPTTIAKWANEGKIKSFRTPGSHRRILVSDLIAFIEQFSMVMPAELAAVLEEHCTPVGGATS